MTKNLCKLVWISLKIDSHDWSWPEIFYQHTDDVTFIIDYVHLARKTCDF